MARRSSMECLGASHGPDGLLITRDGGTWESRQLEESGFWEGGPYTVSIAVDGLEHVGERFIAVERAIVPSSLWGLQAVFLASSSDRSDWIVERGHTACDRGWARMRFVSFQGGLAAIGHAECGMNSYPIGKMTSNGIDWTPSNTGVTNDLTGVRFIDPRFYVLGTDGLVLRSSAQQTDCTLGYAFDPPDTLCLTFRNGTLQSAPTASGPWTDVTETSPYCVKTVFPMMFFRVKYP